jgi:hypothetical protein
MLGRLPASILHFALVESQGRIVAESVISIRNHGIKFYVGNPKGPGVTAFPKRATARPLPGTNAGVLFPKWRLARWAAGQKPLDISLSRAVRYGR